MKYAFIAARRQEFQLTRLCQVLQVSRSGFYAWQGRPESPRAQQNRALLARMQVVHQETHEAYGARKMWQCLRQEGLVCGRHRVARLRRLGGLVAQRRRRFVRSTQARGERVSRPNLLDRQTVTLVVEAWRMAWHQRHPLAGLLHHSDQGKQYTAGLYQTVLIRQGAQLSFSRKGNCYDNAVVESFFSTLKNELTHHRSFRNPTEARLAIFEYIEGFYNRQCLNQALGYRSPEKFEQQANNC